MNGVSMDAKKRSLFEELRLKMGLGNASQDSGPSKKPKLTDRLHGNKNASRDSRNIYLGWLHNGKLVRFKTGGGTRKVNVQKNVRKEALIEESKKIFEEGITERGNVNDFVFDILDYSQCSMPADVSVSDIYTETKVVGYIRFYLSSKTKEKDVVGDDGNIENQDNANRSMSPQIYDEELERSAFSLSENVQELGKCAIIVSDEMECQSQDDILPEQVILQDPTGDTSLKQDQNDMAQHIGETICEQKSKEIMDKSMSNDIQAQDPDILENWNILLRPSPDDTVQFGPIESSCQDYSFLQDEHVNENETLNDMSPAHSPKGEQVFRFHRSNILPEMIKTFKTDIVYIPIKVELVAEKGSDADGVSREVYTLFWNEFYSKCEGEVYRVPVITPEYATQEWTAVARILCKGYIDHRIFPLCLAPAFMVSLLHSEDTLTDEELLASFKLFNNNLDREIIDIVLQNGMNDLSIDDKDCFLDLLGRCGSQEIPHASNAKELLIKVAHKCIIQMPCYITRAMKEIMQQHLKPFFPTKSSILQVYEECQPTAKKVCQLLESEEDLDADQSRSLSFLKQFIRGLNTETVAKVLVLMTASNMIAVEKISVRFTKLRGLERRPIFHTCGPVLELPSTYSTYRDLRQEWNSLIEAGYLNMDIA